MHKPFARLLTIAALAACMTGTALHADSPAPPAISPLATTGPEPESIKPPTPEEVQAAINRGVDFLLEVQRPAGNWGSAERTKGLNIYAPVPGAHDGFRLAVAGLALTALIECEPTLEGERAENVDKAIQRGLEWVFEHHKLARRSDVDALYNTWGHAYAIEGMVRAYRRAEGDSDLQARIKKVVEFQAGQLERYAYLNGGWGYYDFDHVTQIPGSSPNSFVTATGLVALRDAESIGVSFPQKQIDKALASLERQRFPDYSYAYGEYLMMDPRMGINRPGGSLGRSQACNLALRLYRGPEWVPDAVITTWLNRLYARNGWLSIGRKRPRPHESYFQVAGYFYYYGHYYAAMCIEVLPEAERPYFQDHLANILIPLQEKDGSWWDYPFYNYHQQYGTAMALYSLRQCQHKAATGIAEGEDGETKTAMQ